MQTSLQGIAKKAAEDLTYRFRDLSSMLSKENILWCLPKMNKKAAPGVDKVDYEEYLENLDANLDDLVTRLKSGRYKARLIRRKYIPKGKGKKRPLGIPVTEDRLLQTTVAQILKALWEPNFLECSFGYRDRRGAKDAVKALRKELQFGRYHHVVEADIKGFFGAVDHEWMAKMLKQRINDKRFIRLIRKWLRAGVLEEDGRIINPRTGTPQGGAISAVLANIYLHYVLDLWFEKDVKKRVKGKATLIRYADDFVAAFESKAEAEAFRLELKDRLKEFGLELNEEKTNTMMFSRSGGDGNKRFNFLGFEYRWSKSRTGKRIIKLRTSREKLRNSIAKFKEWIKSNRHKKLRKLVETLRRKLKGYWNYYGVINNSKSLQQYYYQVQRLLFKWLNRRSQKLSMNWERFNRFMKCLKYDDPKKEQITKKIYL